MLDPLGNTGVYLLYMYVRVKSVMGKSEFGSDEALEKLKVANNDF